MIIKLLKREMSVAVTEEDYSTAAQIRDHPYMKLYKSMVNLRYELNFKLYFKNWFLRFLGKLDDIKKRPKSRRNYLNKSHKRIRKNDGSYFAF